VLQVPSQLKTCKNTTFPLDFGALQKYLHQSEQLLLAT